MKNTIHKLERPNLNEMTKSQYIYMYFDAETRGIYALSLHILVSEFETTGPIDRDPGALGPVQ